LIPVLINVLNNIIELRFNGGVNFSPQHKCNFVLTYLSVFVAIEQVKGLAEFTLLLLFLLFDAKGHEFAELETEIVVDIQFAKGFQGNLLADLFPIEFAISLNQLLQREHTVVVCIQMLEDGLEFFPF
jgi:hypothetical protein